MSEELDLTNSKWVPENEIYLISIIEGIKEMYPDIDLESEMKESGISYEDMLRNSESVVELLKKLGHKYPG